MEEKLEVVRSCVTNVCKSRNFGRKAALVIVGVIVTKKIYNACQKYKTRQKINKKKQELRERKEKLARSLVVEGSLMTEFRQSVLDLSLEELLEKLREGMLDPLDVLETFQAKALAVDEKLNAVCDYILEATEWAKQLRIIPKEERGPLYGLPISVKECFLVKGYDATIGLAKFIGQPAKDDAPIIKFIKSQHGIPFCLTNIPQTMISYACSNPIYGMTSNPHNLDRTPGGSSGGEAALIAAGASLFGIGGDIGGSLRIPAHCCGIAALKPTTGRIYEGGRVFSQGSRPKILRPCISSVAGFMSSSVYGVKLGMELCINNSRRMNMEDHRVAPIQWQNDLYKLGRKLRIGWYTHDGFFPPTPGCIRAVRETVELLEAAGHEVIEWKDFDNSDIFEVFVASILSDGGHHSLKTWKGEILDQAIELNVLSFTTPGWIRWIHSFLLGLVSKKIQMVWDTHPTQSKDLWKTNADKDRLTDEFYEEWDKQNFDIVICPGFPFPAPKPTHAARMISATSYTGVYNSIGCPVGIVPVTKETLEDQEKLTEYPVRGDIIHRLARHTTTGATGMPIGIQVIGRHFQEELVLHAMETIEDLVNYDKSHSL